MKRLPWPWSIVLLAACQGTASPPAPPPCSQEALERFQPQYGGVLSKEKLAAPEAGGAPGVRLSWYHPIDDAPRPARSKLDQELASAGIVVASERAGVGTLFQLDLRCRGQLPSAPKPAAASVSGPAAAPAPPASAPGDDSPQVDETRLPRVSAALKAADDADFARIANLASFKFHPDPQRVGPDGFPVRYLPAGVSGPAERPHYGVAGFHLFLPADGVLAKPAQLVLGWQPEGVAGLDEESMAIYHWEGNDWVHVGGVLDRQAHTLTARITKLGQYTGAPAMPAGDLVIAVEKLRSGEAKVTVSGLRLNDGRPAPDGTRYNVLQVLASTLPAQRAGEVLAKDADPTLPDTQVESRAAKLSFRVRHAVDTAVRIVVFSCDGTAFGEMETR